MISGSRHLQKEPGGQFSCRTLTGTFFSDLYTKSGSAERLLLFYCIQVFFYVLLRIIVNKIKKTLAFHKNVW